jgi:hypothetical protein
MLKDKKEDYRLYEENLKNKKTFTNSIYYKEMLRDEKEDL